jgi:phage repressor protein C with HTH and peptisase S24 domain
LSAASSNAIFAPVSDGEAQIYRDLMRFKPEGLTPNAWAVKAGVSRTVWSDMRRHGNPSRRTLEKLLTTAGSSLAEFEALRLGPEPGRFDVRTGQIGEPASSWRAAQLPPLFIIASRLAAEWDAPGTAVELIEIRPSERLESLPRPVSLGADAQAFALTVVGNAMSPRFRPGMRIAVSPRAPVAIGDDVMVRLRQSNVAEAQCVLIAQLVRRKASAFELRQFTPGRTFEVNESDVDAVVKIAGELI